jgi:Na+-transporting NADH:ubiquinone oxidoreductase subunit C
VHSNKYTLIYATILSVITAVVLALASEGLKPAQQANIALDKKSNILKAVRLSLNERKTIIDSYEKGITELVINSTGDILEGQNTNNIILKDEIAKPISERHLPIYIYTDSTKKKFYILPMQGVGLWGPIWGYISIEDDFNTVYGAFFDHKSETPGLGAEIGEKPFQYQFQGKKIKDNTGKFISVNVVKKTDKVEFSTEHRVDGITGGTITSKGTNAMLKKWIEPYLPFFEKIIKNSK